MAMEFIILGLYLFGLFVLILRSNFFTVEGVKKPLLVSFWVLKLLVGLCFYVIFSCTPAYKDACNSEYFFKSGEKVFWLHNKPPQPTLFLDFMIGKGSNDSTYQAHAEKIGEQWYRQQENSIVNDNRTVIRINALLYAISFRFYSVHILFMCFISFVGSILLFKAFPKQGKKQIYAATVACFLVPSLLFWSVGVLKEPLIVLGLGGFLFYFRKIIMKFSISDLILLILSSLLLFCIKMYVFALILPLSLVLFCCQRKENFILLKQLVSFVFLAAFCLLSHTCFQGKQADVVRAITSQNQRFYNISIEANRPAFHAPNLDGTAKSLVKNIPLALYNSMTKPFAYPVNNFAKACMNLETILLLLLLLVCLIFGNYRRFFKNNFALFCASVSICGFILIGLTMHDAVVLMRYKSIFLPFYVYALLHLLDTDRVLFIFNRRKRRKSDNYDMVKSFEERMNKIMKR